MCLKQDYKIFALAVHYTYVLIFFKHIDISYFPYILSINVL